jgi:CheY-like chemotaxis protein/signal transduction histidine kinase
LTLQDSRVRLKSSWIVLHSFRARLMTIVGAAALAIVLLTTTGSLAGFRVERQLDLIQRRYMPKVQLGPKLEAELERLARLFQDAVAAQDLAALDDTTELERALLAQLTAAGSALTPAQISAVQTAIEDYFDAAQEVSRRLIKGESGEGLVASISAMQAKQAKAANLLKRSIAFDRSELAAAFSAAARAEADAMRVRLFVSASCLLIVVVLSLWLGRGVLRSLAELGAGLERFGRQNFAEPIRVQGRDEIGALAAQANQMAQSLERLSHERDRADWLKAGHAELVHELRGDLELEEVANRASRTLARYLEAPAAALYYTSGDGALHLLGHHAAAGSPANDAARLSFQFGEGLVGAAAREQQITLIHAPPADYLRVRSGLGEGAPSTLALVPLCHLGKPTGVLELAFFRPWSDSFAELLLSVRESLVIAIEVAQARTVLRALLSETQRQAERLTLQEDELRANNEELQTQQEGLRRANDELTTQTQTLEQQRLALEHKNVELDAARRGIEQKALELTTVSAYKTQFLANMSHELRTPLNSMLLLSNLLAENDAGNLSDKQVEFCRTIYGAGKDLLGLINQVLDLAKIEAGKQQVVVQELELAQLSEHARRVFGPLAREKGLELSVEIAATLPASIVTDPQRVQQIVNNLLGNAIKFTHHGSVSMRIGPVPADARLRRSDLQAERLIALAVSDTGVGIAPEHQERVFAPFEQADGSQDRRYGGTGLGLSIARELAVLLGGELQLSSAAGQGSTFTCYLSRQLASPAVAAHVLPLPASSPAPANTTGARKPSLHARSIQPPRAAGESRDLLVIEDDPVFAEALAHIIRAQGLTLAIAHDGRSGVALAKQFQPRGIILDVRLADIDGWTVMNTLRGDSDTADIPVHFVSALDEAGRGMAMGAVGYLTKPATRDQLVGVVDALVRKDSERACRILIVEDDLAVVDSLVDMLRSESIDVQRASSAQEALKALTTERFNCMVLDLGLPDMDGLELLESLKGHLGAEVLPVVVYTGRALSRQETQRLEAYTEAVVLKDDVGAARVLDEIRAFAQTLKDVQRAKPVLRSGGIARDLWLEGRKILVADDDMRTVYALSALLRAKGAEVVVADTGRAALQALAEHTDVDIVLLDLMMPELDGYQTLALLRSDERFAHLPVIVLTAKAMKNEREKCLDAGANEYLPKPIESDRLFDLLHAFLSEAKPVRARVSHG